MLTQNEKIILSTSDLIYFIDQNNIMFCKSDNCYTQLFLKNGQSILLSESLAKFSEKLNPLHFMRVNQSYLINRNYIKLIIKKDRCIVLLDEKRIPFTIKIRKLLLLLRS